MDIHRVAELAQVGNDPARVGSDVPLARGPAATCSTSIPSSAAVMYVSGASPIVQCECSSSALVPIRARTAGISVRARSGVRRPVGSLMYRRDDIGRCCEHGGEICVERIIMNRADRVGEPGEHFAAFLADHPRAIEERLRVVHRIDQREARDAVDHQRAIRESHELGIRGLPGDETKPGGDELQRRVGCCRAHAPNQCPRILLVRAHAHAHVRARGEIDCLQPDAVHDGCDLQGLGGIQPGGAPDALVAVPDRNIDELDIGHAALTPGSILTFAASFGARSAKWRAAVRC